MVFLEHQKANVQNVTGQSPPIFLFTKAVMITKNTRINYSTKSWHNILCNIVTVEISNKYYLFAYVHEVLLTLLEDITTL